MVAYSFRKRFEAPIQTGSKRHTIRAPRKGQSRHARVGEALQLYTGMRTRHCQKIIQDPVCTFVSPVQIFFDQGTCPEIARVTVGDVTVRCRNRFAQQDGFASLADMAAYWRSAHTITPGMVFDGVLIEWGGPIRCIGLDEVFASGDYVSAADPAREAAL